jgi:DNA-binding transcriptional LysR family regulator
MMFIIDKFDFRRSNLDTEAARTFLAVVAAGNFSKAAERLHVTQSTVSSRMHALEEMLGSRLFVRNKSGATLTTAGRHFQRHASLLVRTVEQARHDIGVAKGFRATLTIGARLGLWEQFLLAEVSRLLTSSPDVAVRVETGLEAALMQGLVEGRLDLAVMYTPESRPGLKVELLFEEPLVLASTDARRCVEPGPGYVYIDWGPEFFAKHSASFPNFIGAALTSNIGWLALQHVLENGGAGYFPSRLIRPHLASGQMTVLPDGPTFSLSSYVVYQEDADADIVGPALEAIRRAATFENEAARQAHS